MHFKFRNKQLTLKNKLNKLKVIHAEQTLCNKSNFIEFLKFTDQNTTHTIDTENNIVTVSTSVRSSGIEIKKSDDTFFNTDIEITGTLTGGRNPYIYESNGHTNLCLFKNDDNTFKIRFRCKRNQFKIMIVDGLIGGVSSELIINEIKVYENKLNDTELDISKSSDISLTNLDTTYIIGQTVELYPVSTTGTTNTMKLYSTNEDMISFVNNKMYVHNTTGNCKIYCKNKYGLGQIFNLEIMDNINIVTESYTKVITTNQELPATFSIYPESMKSKTTITTSNSNAYISENGITGVTPGNVDIIVTVDSPIGVITKKLPFTVVDDGTLYNNINRMKQQNLSEGDTYTTSGYFEDNDGGEATYTIMTYDNFLASLPADVQTVNFYSTETSNAISTPVDEYINHTLDNGLVAVLNRVNDTVLVEQCGCKGDGRFDNIEPLIHLFAQTKQGTIKFKQDNNYALYGRDKNIAYYFPEKYLPESAQSKYKNCNCNQYVSTMCPGIISGSYRGKPCMTNLTGAILDGNGCTITIPANQFALGTNEFGIFEFAGDIDGLEIKGFTFRQNGLKQGSYVGNDGKNHEQPTRAHTIFYGDGNTHKFNNVNIHHNNFYENGTPINISDGGGDFILIINPLESKNVYVEDNYFENWGNI